MFKRTGIISFVLSIIMIFTAVTSAFAESSSCTDCKSNGKSNVVYTNEKTGNKVVEIQKDGKSYYAAVSGSIVNDEFNETKLKEMKEKAEIQNTEVPFDKDVPIVLERVYFQFEETLDDAISTANTPVSVESSDSVELLAKSGFWKGSWIDKIWDLWYGTGYKVHVSSGDANYIITAGATVVTGLFAVLAATGVISAAAAAAVPAIIVVGILTLYQTIRNEDGSVDFEMFEPNLVNIGICVAASQYLGQARNKGTFRNFYWGVYWPGMCF
ncbi:hypothetical protein ACFO9Q_04105 [Paenibacillus sp. GCM10023252]|uniref:hypothetical protein n=1 Tax=Paenibacillus sp. GCM10023252 TaxID=3252649 RepID=UPI003623A990